jgi:hypothetical protein
VLHYDGGGYACLPDADLRPKKFIVYPPEQRFTCIPPGKANFSTVNSLDNPDLRSFLCLRTQCAIFILEPGELLFVPSHWWTPRRC